MASNYREGGDLIRKAAVSKCRRTVKTGQRRLYDKTQRRHILSDHASAFLFHFAAIGLIFVFCQENKFCPENKGAAAARPHIQDSLRSGSELAFAGVLPELLVVHVADLKVIRSILAAFTLSPQSSAICPPPPRRGGFPAGCCGAAPGRTCL